MGNFCKNGKSGPGIRPKPCTRNPQNHQNRENPEMCKMHQITKKGVFDGFRGSKSGGSRDFRVRDRPICATRANPRTPRTCQRDVHGEDSPDTHDAHTMHTRCTHGAHPRGYPVLHKGLGDPFGPIWPRVAGSRKMEIGSHQKRNHQNHEKHFHQKK